MFSKSQTWLGDENEYQGTFTNIAYIYLLSSSVDYYCRWRRKWIKQQLITFQKFLENFLFDLGRHEVVTKDL